MIETIREGLTVIGTAHVSASSVTEVETTIREQKPAKVLVELDTARLHALRNPDEWQKTDIFRILKEKKHHLFLLQIYLSAMQSQMGRATGVPPGSELIRAVQVAEEIGAEVVLIDRSIAITFRRGFGSMGFWEKMKLTWHVIKQLLPDDNRAPPADVEAMLKSDAITQMTEEFAKFAPQVKEALIDERDSYMASHIEEQSKVGATVVAVVGAGHLPGIRNHLTVPESIPPRGPLDLPPRKRRFTVGKVLLFAVPIALALIFGYLVMQGNWEVVRQAALFWILSHVALAGLGAALAFGHPLAVLTGAIASPFTSVAQIRGISSGTLAGLVQAKVVPPVVADFQAIKTMETGRQFWGNRVVRVLTVASLTTLGSYAGHLWFFVYIYPRVVGAL